MGVLYSIIAILVIFAIVIYVRVSKKNLKIENDLVEEGRDDYEKEFFERAQNGEKSQVLLTIASQQDCAIIRSLLHADGIPSYVEGEHMNNIYGGISGTMVTVVGIKLYILCSDYEKAVEIIQESKLSDSKGFTILSKEEA